MTAKSAHLLLEQVIEIQCLLSKSTDFELPVTDQSSLKLSIKSNSEFLVQAELRAIQAGLLYKEID